MKEKYIITLDKEKISFELYGKNYNDIKDLLEVVYEGICLKKTAMEKFDEIIERQAKEYHIPGNTKIWKVVRLFDKDGNQIAQES